MQRSTRLKSSQRAPATFNAARRAHSQPKMTQSYRAAWASLSELLKSQLSIQFPISNDLKADISEFLPVGLRRHQRLLENLNRNVLSFSLSVSASVFSVSISLSLSHTLALRLSLFLWLSLALSLSVARSLLRAHSLSLSSTCEAAHQRPLQKNKS